MRQQRRSSASGRRQTGQTDRPSRSNLAESKQAAGVNQNQHCSQLQSLLLVCGTSQPAPWGAVLVLPSFTWHWSGERASPIDLARSATSGLGERCQSSRQPSHLQSCTLALKCIQPPAKLTWVLHWGSQKGDVQENQELGV